MAVSADWAAVLAAIRNRGDTRPLASAIQASGGRVPLPWIEALAAALGTIPPPSRAEIQRRALAAYRALRRRKLSVAAATEMIRTEYGLSSEEAAEVARGGLGRIRKRRMQIPAHVPETRRAARR